MSRETALKNAINRTTSFHDITIPDPGKDQMRSLLILNPHSYFKVIINGNSSKGEFTAVLDILDGDIFTINFKGNTTSNNTEVSFKTENDESLQQQILFVTGISNIETLTVEYFDYFEINLDKTITIETTDSTIIDCQGNQIYYLKPITTSNLAVRNALTANKITAKEVINVKNIKMGPWIFSVNGDEISTTISHVTEESTNE